MKKRVICFIIGMLLVAQSGMTVSAAPAIMPDGELFDAEYYAEHNPDVVAAIGNDMHALYAHYQQSGILEGRQPYVPGTDVEAAKAAALAVSILDSRELTGGRAIKEYDALPVFAGTLWQPVREGNTVVYYLNGQAEGSTRANNQACDMCGDIMDERMKEAIRIDSNKAYHLSLRTEYDWVEIGEFKVIDGWPGCNWKAGPSHGMLVSKYTWRVVEGYRD